MGRILGIDYGTRRIGMAVSDEAGMLATPLCTAEVRSAPEAVAAVCRVAKEKAAVRIVVGLPLNMDGTKGPMAQEAEAFAQRLAERSGLPVDLSDERLSSGLVERTLLEADLSRGRRKEVRDKLAAQVILQGYLDAKGLMDA
jgi:putative Holliday junction resolvase